jgi:hypothetical protein
MTNVNPNDIKTRTIPKMSVLGNKNGKLAL